MNYKFTLKQNLNYYLSHIRNLFKIFYNTPDRKKGISVMMRVKNEGEWIDLSLKSITSFADEVVIIDNGSTDNTLRIIKKLIPKLPYEVKLKQNKIEEVGQISNQALSLTEYKWIVRWDGDFIAYTEKKRNIANLRKYLLSLNQNNFYLIYPLLINFSYDLKHLRKNRDLHSENYIHTYHPACRYISKGSGFEVLKVPYFFQVKRVLIPHFVHMGFIKTIEKLLERYFRFIWRNRDGNINFDCMLDFIKITAKQMWGVDRAKDIMQKIFDEQKPYLYKYDKEKYGDYPQLLKPRLKKQKYKILCKNGEPYTRNDIKNFSEEKIDDHSDLYQK